MSLTTDDGVAELRLIRGEDGNAIDAVWVQEFHSAVMALVESDARAVLITAEGDAFTVGGDLKYFAARTTDLAAAFAALADDYSAALEALATLHAPVIAAVQGPIAGGGLGLAYCSDIVLVSPAARFVCGFSRLGFSGDGGSSWWLPRLVGLRRATELMLENRVLSAQEAVDLGIATRLVEATALADEARRLAAKIAAGPRLAFAHMRRLLRESGGVSLPDGLAAETAAMLELGAGPDAQEGVQAFVARRPPRFSE